MPRGKSSLPEHEAHEALERRQRPRFQKWRGFRPRGHVRSPAVRHGRLRGARMNDIPWIDWYQSLAKPSWTPVPRTIGLIWQILYPVILATFDYVFVHAARGRPPLLVALPFAINIVANLMGSPHRVSRRFLGKPPLSLPRMSGSTTAPAPSPAEGCACGRWRSGTAYP